MLKSRKTSLGSGVKTLFPIQIAISCRSVILLSSTEFNVKSVSVTLVTTELPVVCQLFVRRTTHVPVGKLNQGFSTFFKDRDCTPTSETTVLTLISRFEPKKVLAEFRCDKQVPVDILRQNQQQNNTRIRIVLRILKQAK